MPRIQLILDIECYKNYFLAMFYSPENNKYIWFEQTDENKLNIEAIATILNRCEIVTFNGINYDIPVLSEAMRGGRSCGDIRLISDLIIQQDQKCWQIEKRFGKFVSCDHIDLIELPIGRNGLKIYGGRLGCPKLQDLPIEPDATLTREQMDTIREYCKNDVLTTAALLKKLTPQIELRRTMSQEYGVDLRSKSDAQIAEAVIAKEIERIRGVAPKKPGNLPKHFFYTKPAFLQGLSEAVECAIQEPFSIKGNGVIEMPELLEKLVVTINDTSYQLGMGGIHSTEKSRYYETPEFVKKKELQNG